MPIQSGFLPDGGCCWLIVGFPWKRWRAAYP
jgi:hypothetical protein